MNYRSIFIFTLFVCGACHAVLAAPEVETKSQPKTKDHQKIRLIIRTDDIGFCHGANMAIKRILDRGVVTSVSVIVNTPWLDEAVEILKDHPEVSVGVHTNLNSEWREYRWGPVLPYDKVPSLVDKFGKFFGTRRDLMLNRPRTSEVAAEIRAQIELALKKGLRISYCDHHMGAAVNCLEFQEELEKLAREYNLVISRYFGEADTKSIYTVPPERKTDAAIESIRNLPHEGLFLMVLHPGTDTPEMAAMTDLNSTGLKEMSRHRQAEADVLCDSRFKAALKDAQVELTGYADLLKEFGTKGMKRPSTAKRYDEVLKEALQQETLTK
jgi:hypothetical protein